MSIPLDQILDEILDGLESESGSCVLFLGPDVAKNGDGEWMQSGLLRHLKERLNQGTDLIKEDVDNLIKCDDERTRSRAFNLIRNYHQRNGTPNELHRQLALIPFHLVLSITPDRLMAEALRRSGVPHDFVYYVKKAPHPHLEVPSRERPLVYNLFGSTEDQQSLVLTHGDLLDFLFSILGKFRPPEELFRTMQEAQYFVFLGFDFDKWYLQLLFHLFDKDKNKVSVAVSREADEGDATPKDQWPDTVRPWDFYYEKYKVAFVEESIEEFVERLYGQCKEQGLLRQPQEETSVSLEDEIAAFIKQDEIKQALEHLYRFIDTSVDAERLNTDKVELLAEITAHQGRITRSERDLRMKLSTPEQAEVARQQVVHAIQSIAHEIEA